MQTFSSVYGHFLVSWQVDRQGFNREVQKSREGFKIHSVCALYLWIQYWMQMLLPKGIFQDIPLSLRVLLTALARFIPLLWRKMAVHLCHFLYEFFAGSSAGEAGSVLVFWLKLKVQSKEETFLLMDAAAWTGNIIQEYKWMCSLGGSYATQMDMYQVCMRVIIYCSSCLWPIQENAVISLKCSSQLSDTELKW